LPTLCLGEALVDLICERPVASLGEADVLVRHFGGAVANVAVVAAQAGAQVVLAGGAGLDDWGWWLRERLALAGVGLSFFELIEGRQTRVAAVTVDEQGDASYQIYGEPLEPVAHALGERIEEAVDASGALFMSSNTLVSSAERAMTMGARELALQRELPVIFDPNLRLHRWRSKADAAASANACVSGALLVRANRAEAALMTGEDDPERAATSLVKAGARMVVITLGRHGAILRGEFHDDVPGVPVQVLSTIGAGDVMTGTLLARLAATNFYPAAVPAGLRDAVADSARACQRWGALE
jgi:fructokinase